MVLPLFFKIQHRKKCPRSWIYLIDIIFSGFSFEKLKNNSLSNSKLAKEQMVLDCMLGVIRIGACDVLEYFGPLEIVLKSDTVNGFDVLRSNGEELVVQDYDSEGNLLGTQSMWAYRLKANSNKYARK